MKIGGEEGCIVEQDIVHGDVIGDTPLLFEIPRLEAVDIDEESDFQIADILMRQRLENK